MANVISEDQIERALLQRLQHACGFDVLNCHTTDPADLMDGSGRKDKRDVLENFVLFHRETNKILAQNHQFIGVNHALAQFEMRNAQAKGQRGKLGVFWHTQGSGKSFSMVFYVRKIFDKPELMPRHLLTFRP